MEIGPKQFSFSYWVGLGHMQLCAGNEGDWPLIHLGWPLQGPTICGPMPSSPALSVLPRPEPNPGPKPTFVKPPRSSHVGPSH
ncbi:hypothetical protein ACLOJK_001255 [Asimina triloba]